MVIASHTLGKTIILSHREFALLRYAQACRTTERGKNRMKKMDREHLNDILNTIKEYYNGG